MIAFLKENFRWVAGGFLLTFFSSFGQTFFISASAGEWREAFGLSHGEFGQLFMMATLASALCLPFLGRIVDYVPEHRVIAFTIPILAAATVLAAFAPNAAVLAFAIWLLRLFGQGMMTHIALTATGRWFAAQRGRAVALVVLGHKGGEAILPFLYTAIAVAYGFKASLIAGAGALLLIALPVAVWAYHTPRHPRGHAPEEPVTKRGWTRGEVLRDPWFWVLLTGVLMPPFLGTTIFFHQDYLALLNGWPPQAFSTGMAVMAATSVVFSLINGAMLDKFGAKSVLPWFLLPLGAACYAVSISGSVPSLILFMFLLGVSYGISSTLFGALWPEIYGTEHLGAVRSMIVAAMVLATAIGPGLTGTLIDAGISVPEQMRVFAAYCLAASALMWLASRQLRARDRAEMLAEGTA